MLEPSFEGGWHLLRVAHQCITQLIQPIHEMFCEQEREKKMPNYINTDALVDGLQADAADVKTPLETLDQELFDLAG